MSFKFRTSKMSRNVSRHSGVSCDACGKGSFSGKRYKCLVCYDFDLCAECYETGETGNGRHATTHPMQCILTRVDTDLFFGGENHSTEQTTSFTCPLCGQVGFSEAGLRDHVTKQHSDPSMLQEVICPVCAAHPTGDPNHLTDDLPTHLTMEHRAFRDMEQDPTVVQSRVRRLIGRRRAGLDRYASILSREASQSHDYDPITELLSQLSSDRGAGGSGAARRIPPDVPPHIQQLLEQQERQALERGSPMRRPICRRVLASGGSEYGDSPGNVYVIPGGSMFSSHPSKLDPAEVPRGFLIESGGREGSKSTDRGGEISKDPKCLLSNYSLPQLSEEEQEKLEHERADKSLFVQDLLLSTLAYSSESSSNETSDKEDT